MLHRSPYTQLSPGNFHTCCLRLHIELISASQSVLPVLVFSLETWRHNTLVPSISKPVLPSHCVVLPFLDLEMAFIRLMLLADERCEFYVLSSYLF